MTSLAQDVRFSLRLLARDRGFTAVTLSILALAIGTTTPTFSMLNAYLLRPLPFFEPERLVHVWATDTRQGWNQGRISVPEFLDWRREARGFESLAAFNYTAETLSGGDQPEEVSAGRVSANTFDVLGRRAALGRTFLAGEDEPGAAEVVVLSDAFWRSRYDADRRVLGRTLELGGRDHTIVGVMPADFVFPLPTTRLWVPRVLDAGRHPREQSLLQVVGRLSPGVSRRQAQAEMTALAMRLAEQYPQTNRDRGADVADLRRSLNFGDQILRLMSVVLFVAHGFVLLIACGNVAALLLARAFGRARELAVRAGRGATRRRRPRQPIIKSARHAVGGGVLGTLLARALIRALSSVIPEDLYRVGELSLDAPALAFTLGVSLLATLLSGLTPALRVSQVDLAQAFRDAGAALSASRPALRLQSLLVVGQIGLAAVLLIGTGLMLRTFRAVQDVDPGFDPRNVLTLELKPSREAYPTDEQVGAFHRRLLEEARRLPGVRAAGTVNHPPLNHESQPVEWARR
jgi:putative ABC transport system permease protein